jgi:hypothetical protein
MDLVEGDEAHSAEPAFAHHWIPAALDWGDGARAEAGLRYLGALSRRWRNGPWQVWLNTLPAAAELMARAAGAPHRHARERLVALAALRSGTSLRTVASELRWSPARIRAWLDEGARIGLDAPPVLPRSPPRPPDAPTDIAAVTAWLAGVHRPSCGFHLWTVENLTAAVNRNLGIRLSPAGALRYRGRACQAPAGILPAPRLEAAKEQAMS